MISVQFNYQSSPMNWSWWSVWDLRITDQQTFKEVDPKGWSFFLKETPLGNVTIFWVTSDNICWVLIEWVDYVQAKRSISLSVKTEIPLTFIVLPYKY